MSQDKDPIPRTIAEEATRWIVRRDGGPLPAEEAARFNDWLRDPRHQAALDRLESIWSSFDAESELAPPPALPPLRGPTPRRAAGPAGKRQRRRAIVGTAIAASLMIALLGGIGDWPLRLRADHVTAVGERRTVYLADGSTVELDSRSAIAVDLSEKRRRIRLLAGAALFQVSPDPARPFTVIAEGGSVTALGTAFQVREEGGAARVTVTEHKVRVEGNGRAAVVGEGQRADFGKSLLQGPLPADSAATAWTRGRLVVANRPLAEVVAEIARYRRGFVTVSGPAAALRVSGVYDLDHPLAAIDGIEKSLGLTSIRLSNRVIVLRR
jgi:transmembrane sensor